MLKLILLFVTLDREFPYFCASSKLFEFLWLKSWFREVIEKKAEIFLEKSVYSLFFGLGRGTVLFSNDAIRYDVRKDFRKWILTSKLPNREEVFEKHKNVFYKLCYNDYILSKDIYRNICSRSSAFKQAWNDDSLKEIIKKDANEFLELSSYKKLFKVPHSLPPRNIYLFDVINDNDWDGFEKWKMQENNF